MKRIVSLEKYGDFRRWAKIEHLLQDGAELVDEMVDENSSTEIGIVKVDEGYLVAWGDGQSHSYTDADPDAEPRAEVGVEQFPTIETARDYAHEILNCWS